jgi:hypothetical protein
MKMFRIAFTRIGQATHVDPLVCDATGPADLACRIHDHVRRHLASRDLTVDINLTARTGVLLAGVFPAGHFTVQEFVPDPAAGEAPAGALAAAGR